MQELTDIHLNQMQFVVLGVALTLVLAQLFVKQKNAMHILFAIFCGSVAIASAQQITGDSLGAYRYLIGMGACATCNGYWLLSRTLFRVSNPFDLRHVLVAVAVASLVMVKQGYLFLDSFWQFAPAFDHVFAGVLREITIMLSSCILLLMIWEGFRGFNQASQSQKTLRIIFLTTIISAIGLSKFISVSFHDKPEMVAAIIAGITITVMMVTQGLIYRVNQIRKIEKDESIALQTDSESSSSNTQVTSNTIDLDYALADQIRHSLIRHKQFLQANLKVADIARELDVSEYRVSRVLKHHFKAKNFNQYVNELRIEHAQKLMADPDNKKWPVLVIGLESGFASVGPFTRAFKQFTGVTPNQYRQEQVEALRQQQATS